MQAGYAAPPAPPSPLWRNRDYMLLWSGQTVSTIGTQVSAIAFPLLVLALTNSPIQAGLVSAAQTFATSTKRPRSLPSQKRQETDRQP